jgi:GNAT superfamily N-acetyltransferase
VTIRRLDWDSRFFDREIGSVEPGADAARAVAEADASGFDCLYWLVPADDPETLWSAQQAGFRTVDIRVTLGRDVPQGRERRPNGIRVAGPGDVTSLEPLARERFVTTRFFTDPHFARDRSAALYVAWLVRGVSTSGRRTLMSEGAEGFVICDHDADASIGTIEMIVVSAEAAGTGLGSALLHAAQAAFAAARLRHARVVTQGRNVAAQRLYQAHGYRTVDTAVWLHRWRPGSGLGVEDA